MYIIIFCFSPWAQMDPGTLCGVKMVLGDQETLSNPPLPSPEGSRNPTARGFQWSSEGSMGPCNPLRSASVSNGSYTVYSNSSIFLAELFETSSLLTRYA